MVILASEFREIAEPHTHQQMQETRAQVHMALGRLQKADSAQFGISRDFRIRTPNSVVMGLKF